MWPGKQEGNGELVSESLIGRTNLAAPRLHDCEGGWVGSEAGAAGNSLKQSLRGGLGPAERRAGRATPFPSRSLKADMHAHTCYSGWRHLRFIHPRDCYTEPLALYKTSLERGMDLVAITDHDTIEGALRLLDNGKVDASKVIVGEEVECCFPETGQWVHVNVYGLGENDHRLIQGASRDVREVAAYCRERGLLHVLNHPFQSYHGQKPLKAYVEDLLELFTHAEGLNGGVDDLQNLAVQALCAKAASWGKHIVQVGGSDAHVLRRAGRAWTEASASSAPEFLEAVRRGHCKVGGTGNTTPGLMRDVAEVIWNYYARLYTGRGEATGRFAYFVDAAFATLSLCAIAAGLPAWIVLISQLRQKASSLRVLGGLSGLVPSIAKDYNPLS